MARDTARSAILGAYGEADPTELVIANFTQVAIGSLLVALICAGEWKTKLAYIVSFFAIPALAFQPTQINHLLWPIEPGWF
jgi:hypothetical protein